MAAMEQPHHILDVAGTGSEYFRVWIVNMLLILLRLSLYCPWAKVRRLRHVYRNTLADHHPLDFHGSPLKMLRGYRLVGVLALLYSVVDNFSALAGLLALLIVAGIWPALLKSSLHSGWPIPAGAAWASSSPGPQSTLMRRCCRCSCPAC